MTAMRISEVSRRSGIPRTTLRYYEDLGLLPAPPRSGSGYRLYDDGVLARLALISRAKALGVRLDDMTDLVGLLDGDECEPVAQRLLDLVADKRREIAVRIDELTQLQAELETVARDLNTPVPGPCGDDCACMTSEPRQPLIMIPHSVGEVCTLDEANMTARLVAWSAVAQGATSIEDVDGGVRLTLAEATDVGEVARLAGDESTCCPIFEFQITVDARGRAIEVRVPAGREGTVRDLLSVAS
jgi:MerR family copper efflux transcriptional regulator